MYLCHFIVSFSVFIFFKVSCEVFSAISDLEKLLDVENFLIDTLQNYIKAEEQKLHALRKYVNIYQDQHNKAIKDVNSYISNPINAFTLVKRLTNDWNDVEELMSTQISTDFLNIITYYKKTRLFPTNEDLNGAAMALTRLQETYKLDTSSLARGEINGIKYSAELTAADCFEVGRQSYNKGYYHHAWSWMKEAEGRLNKDKNETISQSDILEYLAFSIYKQGDLSLALDLTNKLLEIVPTHPTAMEDKLFYEAELERMIEAQKKKKEEESEEVDYSHYESLCRGGTNISDEIASKLKCRYLSNNNPFLKLAPFKVEEAYLKPDLFVFHDVMTDTEIETVKRLALPQLQRASVKDRKTGKRLITENRISKSAWLKEEEHKHIADMSQRVEDMTGLSMKTAEDLQVVNYGIGGHYIPHYDFAKRHTSSDERGNRIATVIFYMSDVAQGGATVFPKIGAAVWPKKGTAAFWYNLYPSGDGDSLTLHAACPVLVGSKWVANKWIRELEQEVRRPCTLERPPEHLTV